MPRTFSIPILKQAEKIEMMGLYDYYSLVAPASTLPTDIPGYPNVREPNPKSPICKEIFHTLVATPERFMQFNRGVIIAVKSAKVHKKNGLYHVDIEILEPSEGYDCYGVCNGGHTLKAIELDPNHAESHLSLATIKFFHNWDFDGAETSLNKALSLSLNSALINQVHGWFLIAKGDFKNAIGKMEQALVLDPLSLPLRSNLGDAYSFAGRFDEALAQYDRIIEMDTSYRRGFEGRGMIFLAKSDYQKAIADFEQYHKLVGNPLKGLSSLGHAYAAAGQTDKAMECLEKLRQREKTEPGVLLHMDYAFLYSGLKDFDQAFFYLNKT